MELKLKLFRKENISIRKSNKLKAPLLGLFYVLFLIRGKFIYTSFHIGNILFHFVKLKGVSFNSCKVS